MLRGLTDMISYEWVFAVLAASGGIARIVTGTMPRCPTSTFSEACRILFVAMPLGIVSAMFVADRYGEVILAYASAFFVGVISLNVVRFVSSEEGFNKIKEIIIRILTGKDDTK